MEEAHESESDVEFCEFITYSYFCHLKQTTFVKCTFNIFSTPLPNLHLHEWVSPRPPPLGVYMKLDLGYKVSSK